MMEAHEHTQQNVRRHLSLAQEKCLKQQLLNLAIQREVDAIFLDKQKVHETTFLKFVYDKILDFPLWSQRPEARAKCHELLMALPTLLKHSQKATKRDPRNKSTRQVVSKCFDMALRTSLERQDDQVEQQLDITSRLDDQDRVVNSATQTIMDKYDYRSVFCLIRSHPSISILPVQFQHFNVVLVHTLAIWIDEELQEPQMLKKLKTIQLLTPTLAIRAILAISNPVKLMQNVLSLLLARPFGSWNLMQKLFAVMVDLKKTERLLKEAQQQLDEHLGRLGVDGNLRKKVAAKVRHFVKLEAVPLLASLSADDSDSDDEFTANESPSSLCQLSAQTAVAIILAAESAQPAIGEHQQRQLLSNLETVARIHEYFLLVERLHEKTDFIELLGNEQMLTILRELLPVIYTPMAQLFTKARVGAHFHTLFKTLKRIIKVTSLPGGPKRYVPILARFTNELYSFLHESAANDDHSVEDALSWLGSLLAFAQEETLDLAPLVEALDSTTYELLLNETDQVAAFYSYRAALKVLQRQEDDETDEDEMDEDGAPTQTNPPTNTTNSHTTTIPSTALSTAPSTTASTPPTTKTLPEVLRPNLTYIPLLVDNFITMIKLHLSHQGTTTNSTSTTSSPKVSTPAFVAQSQQSKRADSSHTPLDAPNAPLAGTPHL